MDDLSRERCAAEHAIAARDELVGEARQLWSPIPPKRARRIGRFAISCQAGEDLEIEDVGTGPEKVMTVSVGLIRPKRYVVFWPDITTVNYPRGPLYTFDGEDVWPLDTGPKQRRKVLCSIVTAGETGIELLETAQAIQRQS